MSHEFTSSEIRSWLTCRKKWWFRYHEKLGSKRQHSAMTFGTIVHIALEAYFLGRDWQEAIAKFVKVNGTPWDVDNEEGYQLAMANAMVSQYISNGAWEMLNHTVVACEWKFSVPVKTPSGRRWGQYTFSGKIDMITKDKWGNVYLWDFKTGSKDLDLEWAKLDSQMENYLWGYSQSHKVPAFQVIYSQLRKPTIKPKRIPVRDDNGFKQVFDVDGARVWIKEPCMETVHVDDGTPVGKNHGVHVDGKPRQMARPDSGEKLLTRPETPAEYEARLVADIKWRPHHYFKDANIIKTAKELQKIQERLWAMAHEIGNGYICTASSSCQFYGCQYREICIQDSKAGRLANFKIVERHEELREEEGEENDE